MKDLWEMDGGRKLDKWHDLLANSSDPHPGCCPRPSSRNKTTSKPAGIFSGISPGDRVEVYHPTDKHRSSSNRKSKKKKEKSSSCSRSKKNKKSKKEKKLKEVSCFSLNFCLFTLFLSGTQIPVIFFVQRNMQTKKQEMLFF